ncbi:MAG: zinc-dependent metalloprotease [Candidatus Nanopelagicales bacterium]
MSMVDWDTATAVGRRFVPPGPAVTAAEAEEVVESLTAAAAAAVIPVRQTTRLVADPGTHRTVVVDRPAWIESNIAGMRLLTSSLERRVDERRDPNSFSATAGGKATALQLGGMLSWVATKVLGQYEAITGPGNPGRLLLVAPNIVATEQQLDVPHDDFRMWVCLHEETHRVQFGAVPWLEDHFTAEVDTFLAGVELSNADALRRVAAIAAAVFGVLRGGSGVSIIDAAQTPAQRQVFERMTAFMSLLEGHADYVMDAVGPEIVPSLPVIRSRFDQRRENPGAGDGLLRRLMGMDAKLRQYTEGRAFVSGVVDREGIEGFNQVWAGPQNLPTTAEIADPGAWVDRVLS